jgi:hypothetical protein
MSCVVLPVFLPVLLVVLVLARMAVVRGAGSPAVEPGREVFSGQVMAAVDFEAAAACLGAGELPCSSGEGQVLRLAAGIAAGVPADLREILTGLDRADSGLAVAAVLHAAGHRDLLAGRGERW